MNFFICRTNARRFTKGMALAVVTTLGILNGLEAASASTFVVGGFDVSRGGIYSFPVGTSLDEARASLSTNFPGASFNSFPTLTPAALAGVDVLILSPATTGHSHIVPLSSAEQSALLAFVQGGGCAILFPDNSTFGGGGTDAANESLIDPFGLDVAGTEFAGLVNVTVDDPSASSITSGPFGVISSFSQRFSGGITNLGPFAISLATNNLGTALAVIEKGAISPGSGRVVIYSDINAFGDGDAGGVFAANELLFLNTIDFCLDAAGPVTTNTAADPNPVAIGSNVDLTATVDDTGTGASNIASAEYSLDGGAWTTMIASNGFFLDEVSEEVEASFNALSVAGIYDLCVRGTDQHDNVGDPECIMLVVYDPSGGFVTGGGWIDSPEGAYVDDPSLTGKANFGFVSKYKKGAMVPTGNTEFQFKAGGLNFHSSSYDFLVITTGGTNALFKGFGTINGGLAPNGMEYRFMIWANDDSPDTFRIRIWWESGGEMVVYDNEVDQPIGGGSIVIHTKGKK